MLTRLVCLWSVLQLQDEQRAEGFVETQPKPVFGGIPDALGNRCAAINVP